MTHAASHHALPHRHGARASAWTALPNAIPALIREWSVRHRYRRDLAKLDAHLLADIGFSGDEARLEASKPFWRP